MRGGSDERGLRGGWARRVAMGMHDFQCARSPCCPPPTLAPAPIRAIRAIRARHFARLLHGHSAHASWRAPPLTQPGVPYVRPPQLLKIAQAAGRQDTPDSLCTIVQELARCMMDAVPCTLSSRHHVEAVRSTSAQLQVNLTPQRRAGATALLRMSGPPAKAAALAGTASTGTASRPATAPANAPKRRSGQRPKKPKVRDQQKAALNRGVSLSVLAATGALPVPSSDDARGLFSPCVRSAVEALVIRAAASKVSKPADPTPAAQASADCEQPSNGSPCAEGDCRRHDPRDETREVRVQQAQPGAADEPVGPTRTTSVTAVDDEEVEAEVEAATDAAARAQAKRAAMDRARAAVNTAAAARGSSAPSTPQALAQARLGRFVRHAQAQLQAADAPRWKELVQLLRCAGTTALPPRGNRAASAGTQRGDGCEFTGDALLNERELTFDSELTRVLAGHPSLLAELRRLLSRPEPTAAHSSEQDVKSEEDEEREEMEVEEMEVEEMEEEVSIAYAKKCAAEEGTKVHPHPAPAHRQAAQLVTSASSALPAASTYLPERSADRAQSAPAVRMVQPASTALHPPPVPASHTQLDRIHPADAAAAPVAGKALAVAQMPLPPPAVMPSLEEGMEAVEALLGRCRLPPYYAAKFDEMGYDDVRYLYSMHDRSEMLDALAGDVGLKPGHRARLADVLQREARQVYMHT